MGVRKVNPMNKRGKEKKYIKFLNGIFSNLKNLRARKYTSKFSKKIYNNWVLIALLALRQRMDKSYREFADILEVCTDILNMLGISKAPHFTTLQKAAKRLNVQFLEKIMSGFIFLTMTVCVRTGIDATGFQLTRASAHYTKVIKKDKKKRRKIKKYLKLTAFVDLDKQLIISHKIRRSPANDSPDFKPAVRKGKEILEKAGKRIRSVDADKGYDAEENHRLVVEELKAEDRMRIKNKDIPIWRTKGEYRKKAKKRINKLRANYRSKNETVFSVIKRIHGSMIRSRNVSMQNKELLFKEIAYNAGRLIKNIMLSVEDFYRAPSPRK